MQLRMFSIPAQQPGEATEELNRFLRGHRVLHVQKQLVGNDGGAYWAVAVEYIESVAGAPTASGFPGGKVKIDYREVLSAEDFAVFARLREVRKALADKELVPPYTVATNEQLAALVTGKVKDKPGMAAIEGIGAGRMEKYADLFLAELNKTGGPAPQAAVK